MHYLVLLYDDDSQMNLPGDDGFEAEMAGYEAFGELAGPAIVGGEALLPSSTTRTIRVVDGSPSVTAGPYVESTEVLGGFYVLDVPTLDDCIELVRHIPATATGCAEIRPIEVWMGQSDDTVPDGAARFMATIHGKATEADVPGTAAWEAGAAEHGRFVAEAGPAVVGGAAVHPAATASTVRVRDGELLVTDGPFAEGAEVVGGFYLLTATPEAIEAVAAAIPVPAQGAVELRPVMELDG